MPPTSDTWRRHWIAITTGPLVVISRTHKTSSVRPLGTGSSEHSSCRLKIMATPPPRPDVRATSTTAYTGGMLSRRHTSSLPLSRVSMTARTSNERSVIVCWITSTCAVTTFYAKPSVARYFPHHFRNLIDFCIVHSILNNRISE